MNEMLDIGFTKEEAIAMDAEIERMLGVMQKANEQIARDQVEIEALQEETRMIIARIKERPYVELVF